MEDKILIGLSGGINSMALLFWLAEQPDKPKEVHLFYIHLSEHSDDTLQFVIQGMAFAEKHFKKVVTKISMKSVLTFFEEQKMIPHPKFSPCTRLLKIFPITAYMMENGITIDLVGYVKSERQTRAAKQQKQGQDLFISKQYPILDFDDEWCFEIVDRLIGWHPAIYDIRWDEEDYKYGLCKLADIGKRVFRHNNCLPCKNMTTNQLASVKRHFPNKWLNAQITAEKIQGFWGRNKAEYYSKFGKDEYNGDPCEHCAFD